jgi:DNA-binding CsgD family transcriptional regulator
MSTLVETTALSDYISAHDSLLSQLPGQFTIKDLENRFAFASDSAACLAGYKTGAQMQGLNCYDLKNPMVDYADKLTENNLKLMRQTKLKRFIYLCKDAGGNTSTMLMSKKPILDSNSQVIGLYSTVEKLSAECSMIETVAHHGLSIEKPFFEITNQYGHLDLSRREVECFFFLLRGRSNNDIAKRLTLSKRTVDTYIENIKNKLNCNSRTEIFDYAYARGYMYILPEMFFRQSSS